MKASDLRHAYAVLGLTSPVTEARLKRRYKALVKRWHPDRYQADPIGEAEATERLRQINIAYELVMASFGSSEPAPVKAPGEPAPTAAPQFTWSPERVDAIVESINRMNSISWTPEMSVQRWISVGVVTLYLVVAIALFPRREINRIVEVAFYLLLPFYLIWTSESEDRGSLDRLVCRVFGWLFMAAPAAVAILFWMAS